MNNTEVMEIAIDFRFNLDYVQVRVTSDQCKMSISRS